jgi:hypothetical protein
MTIVRLMEVSISGVTALLIVTEVEHIGRAGEGQVRHLRRTALSMKRVAGAGVARG